MKLTSYPGIDYSAGRSNYDTPTGIRFALISLHSLNYDILNDFEGYYGDPTCPSCGVSEPKIRATSNGYYCDNCEASYDCEQVFPDEPLHQAYTNKDYDLIIDESNNVWVFKSPYYTYAQFCSPCMPGACNLDSPLDHNAPNNRCYCLPADWFDEDSPPIYTAWKIDEQLPLLEEK